MSENNYEYNIHNIENIENIENLNTKNTKNAENIKNETDTIIQFNIEDIYKEQKPIEKLKQFNISPIVRRTPNTKANIIIQKIYTNRKNVIKNYQNTLTDFRDRRSLSNVSLSKKYNLNNDNLIEYHTTTPIINNLQKSVLENIETVKDKNINIFQIPIETKQLNNESPSTKNKSIKDTSPSDSSNNSVTPSIDKSFSSDSSNENFYKNDIRYNHEYTLEKKRRKYYKPIKIKKKDKNKPINEIEELSDVSQSSSPRDITKDLWNDSVENYYIEFQKLCKEEAEKYKHFSHRNELISNILKFILLISGCFTFTLSISIPNSFFMSATATISSCLTAIITALSGFFQFDKKCEIQYNIYRELDKLYNTISLEMLKPTDVRSDPYEYILTLRNRRDELMKTLQKK